MKKCNFVFYFFFSFLYYQAGKGVNCPTALCPTGRTNNPGDLSDFINASPPDWLTNLLICIFCIPTHSIFPVC